MFLIFDTETGGIGLDKSLLTAYFLICDEKLEKIGDLYLHVKPDDGVYHVTGEAMGINQINLVEHDKIAIPYKKAGTMLYQFLESCYRNQKEHMVPVGHGMTGDLNHIWQSLLGQKAWESFVSYRRLDTSVALQFLKSCGLFPETVSGSLESLVEYFKIEKVGELHTAKTDTICTCEVLKRMIDLIKIDHYKL